MDEPGKPAPDRLSDLDRRLINRLQSDVPLVARPFLAIASDLGVSEEEVIEAIRRLKAGGIVRRLGGVFSSRDLGFYSTLVAARVPPDQLEETAAVVGQYKEVTHNYEREHAYNLWFTLTATSKAGATAIIEEIKRKTPAVDIRELPAMEFYKVDVKFPV